MLSNEDKNEIIEMLRCPACKGTTYSSIIEYENGFNYSVDCQNCNGTGIRLPENVEEKPSKEEGEDLTEIKLSKEDFQQIQESIENPQYNEKLAEALKRPLGFEQEQSEDVIQLKFKINQLENALAEKDKEIERLKIKNEELRKVRDSEIKHLQIIIHDKEVFISELLTKIKRLKAEKDKEIENVKAQRDKYKEALERINEISIYNASGSITRACFCETFKSIANKALKDGE